MKTDNLTIWRNVPVNIKTKGRHITKLSHSLNPKKVKGGYYTDYGDIPYGQINEQTGQFEECVNPRGRAYAARNRVKHKKSKEQRSMKEIDNV